MADEEFEKRIYAQCTVTGCRDGMVDCPGPCLGLSKGIWRTMDVAGHDPSELWQTFYYSGGYQSWSQHHIGEVIERQGDAYINIGKCNSSGRSLGTISVSHLLSGDRQGGYIFGIFHPFEEFDEHSIH